MNRRHRLLSVLLAATFLTACAAPPPPYPDQPGLTLDTPVDLVDVDLDPVGFDYCAIFSEPRFVEQVYRDDTPTPGPDSCTAHSIGFTATVSLFDGLTFPEISNDPRWRPGSTGMAGNRYWHTTPTGDFRDGHAFLPLGPGRPRQHIHIEVHSESSDGIPLRRGANARVDYIAESLLGEASLILERGLKPR